MPVPPGQAEALSRLLVHRGDARSIPFLKKLLEAHGEKTMAETFLNCGQADLASAAKEWAKEKGYTVGQSYAAPGQAPTWGQ